MYDEIDLEDIECRLYSQIYHSTTENEENGLPSDLPSESDLAQPASERIRSNSRYFLRSIVSGPPAFIPLSEENNTNSETNSKENCSSVNNNISFGTNSTNITTEGIGAQFHNNITFNQYAVPYLINSRLNEVLNLGYTAERYFVPWSVENENLIKPKRNKRRNNRRRKNKKKPQNFRGRENIRQIVDVQQNHVVFISDSDSECEIVNNMNEKADKPKDKPNPPQTTQNAESESDDDIIYIPPPPIEVINVDADIEEEETNENTSEAPKIIESATVENISDSTCHIQRCNTPHCHSGDPSDTPYTCEISTSNDFLDNAGIESDPSKFNFSLHGSDFNNTGDFVRPANPSEYCETESSCSTNDFNRENNCVKTIVFNEVDFPKEDIFSEKNLESFSTYITPKRSTSKGTSNASDDDSSSSSSESDYEPCNVNKNLSDVESNRKLPTLSPMQCDKVRTPDKNLKKKNASIKLKNKQVSTNNKKESKKRRSSTFDKEESGNNTDEEVIPAKKSKKKKASNKKSSATKELDQAVDTELQNKESEGSKNTEVSSESALTNTSVCGEKEVNNSAEKTCGNESHAESDENCESANNTEICSEPSNEQTENYNVTSSRKKKKKNASKSKKNETDNIEASSSGKITSDKGKRKKKKSTSSENYVDDENNSSNNREHVSSEENSNTVATEETSTIKCASANEQSIESVVQCTNESSESLGTASTSKETKSEQEIIILDDTICSDQSRDDQAEIVVSSDSEYDFRDLENVGQDLELINLTTSASDREYFDGTGENVGYDYSKFDVEQIQSTQSDNPDDWRVLARDRLTYLNTKEKGPRCNKCRHFGHIATRCTEKPDPPRCTLCGFSDHQEPRCPHKRCTQCGNEGGYSTTYCWKCFKFRNITCRLCKMTGHIAKVCPDLWRRYHLTTDEGPIVVSQEPQLKSREQLWCSGCAGQGHLEHECNYYNREYPPTNPCIVSYDDVLPREAGKALRFSPPPPPVWKSPERNNFNSNIPSFPSTSQNVPYNNQIFIPQLTNQIANQIMPLFNQNQIVPPNDNIPCNPSVPPESTKVLNPFSLVNQERKGTGNYRVLGQMMSDYLKESVDFDLAGSYESENGRVIHPHMLIQGTAQVLKINQRRVKQILMSMPCQAVKQFLRKELSQLEAVSRCEPKFLKQKLFKYDRLSQSKRVLKCVAVKERCFWYRILNMFIFGVHHYKGGKNHVNYVKRYLSEPKQNKLDIHKRKSLLNAYNYVFNGNRHTDINYYKALYDLMSK